jgi:hypothetical protein
MNEQYDNPVNPAFRLHPGQQHLTPAQEAEARRFADAYIQQQLSTEPVDERAAEAWLKHAYALEGLVAPQDLRWVDGPLQLLALLDAANLGERMTDHLLDRVWANSQTSVAVLVMESLRKSVGKRLRKRVEDVIGFRVKELVEERVGDLVWASVQASNQEREWHFWSSDGDSVRAYEEASDFAVYQFYHTYLAPNAFHALACFNELVSGYWLGTDGAVILRRPRRLCLDLEGRLHSATGTCLEYHDGWGLYAWHGVRVPERVILTPEQLTRQDWREAENVEVRRVVQERMGERFVAELGGTVIDRGPRGTLYEVALLDDPEEVARYVQVRDGSTERQYVLRIPPTIQTADEAVAWSFGMSVEEYRPAQET